MSSSSQLLAAALSFHRGGQLAEAASLYEQILLVEPQHADALHLLGVLANQSGKADLAVDLISRGIRIRPGVTEFHNNLGNALRSYGDHSAAETSYRHAIELDGRNTDALINLGVLLEGQGRLEAAKAFYKRALGTAPKMVRAHMALGNVAVAMGDLRLALKYLKTAVRCSPTFAPAHNALGNALFSSGENEAAKKSYGRAVVLNPGFADAFFNLGNVWLAETAYDRAIEYYKVSIALLEPQVDVYNNLGVAYTDSAQPGAAAQAFARAFALAPRHAGTHFNIGRLLAKEKEHAKAIVSFEQALALKPAFVKALHSLGSSRHALGELDAAVRCYREALRLEPRSVDILSNLASALVLQGSPEGVRYLEQLVDDHSDLAEAHFNLSTALLMQGDYSRGWREYEWRWKWAKFTSPKRGFVQPQWQGDSLGGATILLHAEQGFGDTLQFVRYVPMIVQRGGRVVLEVQPGLKRLLEHLPGVAACIELGEPLPAFNCHCPLMSLPYIFGTTLDTVPPILPQALELVTCRSSARDDDKDVLKVGIVWAGNPNHQNDALRSVSLLQFIPLTAVAGVTFVSLQKGPAALQASEGVWPVDLQEPCLAARDFAETAAVVASLDLVITVDTAMAHLAGAMGKPVWILNSHIPDWRWGLQTEMTPWYPTARLFRRTYQGGWEDLMAQVATELTTFREVHLARRDQVA